MVKLDEGGGETLATYVPPSTASQWAGHLDALFEHTAMKAAIQSQDYFIKGCYSSWSNATRGGRRFDRHRPPQIARPAKVSDCQVWRPHSPRETPYIVQSGSLASNGKRTIGPGSSSDAGWQSGVFRGIDVYHLLVRGKCKFRLSGKKVGF